MSNQYKKKYDRFDLEQQILYCWHITDDIRGLIEHLFDGPESNFTEDNVHNKLLALEQLYDMRLNKLWDIFESVTSQRLLDTKERTRDSFDSAPFDEEE